MSLEYEYVWGRVYLGGAVGVGGAQHALLHRLERPSSTCMYTFTHVYVSVRIRVEGPLTHIHTLLRTYATTRIRVWGGYLGEAVGVGGTKHAMLHRVERALPHGGLRVVQDPHIRFARAS